MGRFAGKMDAEKKAKKFFEGLDGSYHGDFVSQLRPAVIVG